MNQKSWHRHSSWVVIGVIFFMAVVVGLWVINGESFTTLPNEQLVPSQLLGYNLQTYKTTGVLDFSIEIPSEYTVREGLSRVEFFKNGNVFFVDRNGTNYEDINSYFGYLDSINRINVLEEDWLEIGGYEALRRIIEFASQERQLAYYVYVNNWVYSIFTDSPALYDELDAVAQSFRYTGN